MTGNNKQRYRFSEAPIWNIQRKYYEEEGTKAWNNDQVPQYITSNPMIAAAYAEMIFGFLQDRANRNIVQSLFSLWSLEQERDVLLTMCCMSCAS